MKATLPTLAAALLAIIPVTATEQAATADRIPDVTLRTAEGAAVKLREEVAKKPAVLVFYRGGWCPYCTAHLAALSEIHDDLTEAGFQILAIGADQPWKIAATPGYDKFNYTLLSDSGMKAADAFGISFKVSDETLSKYVNDYKIDIEAASGETHHKLPHPAVFIVDTGGTIRYAHVNPDYRTRLEPKKILAKAREFAKETPAK